MFHSPTCQHALRALIYMASKGESGPILVREIAEAAEVPRQSLSKILHGLRNHGFLKSTKGPGGGYQLSRPASQIALLEIVEAVDGPLNLNAACILGLESCSDERACALHEYWKEFRGQYVSTISGMTLEEAVETVERKHGSRYPA